MVPSIRPSHRALDALREIEIIQDFITHPEGSVLIRYGQTKVICTASIANNVPYFLKGKGQGWLTAEYGMLPRSTHERMNREATQGKQSGRTLEIQRLIGRALRSCINLKALGERTIQIDCDVIQADGGTRTASITGACVAMVQALRVLQKDKRIITDPFVQLVAAISVGIYKGEAIVDLDYLEDSKADTDMNLVGTESGAFIEIQGTAENKAFSATELNKMLELGQNAIQILISKQKTVLNME